jgi:DNA-binding transcriptional ArsR family regulator
VRFRIWELLREGPATASQLARRLGESRGSASYHLRVLGRAGAITEDDTLGTRRERWWRRPEERIVIVPGSDAEGRAIDERMLAVFFARDEEVRARYVAARPSGPWHESSFIGNWLVRLTPEGADALGRALFAIVDDLRRQPAPPDGEQTLVSVSVLPVLDPQ